MRELRKNSGMFSREHGWDDEKRAALVFDLLKYLQTIDKKRCRIFACSIDLDVHRANANLGKRLADPITLCNFLCPQVASHWYLHDFPGIISEARFHFDKTEPFRHNFERCWRRIVGNRFDMYGHREGWSMIRSIDTMDSAKCPSMQAADLLAWGLCDDSVSQREIHALPESFYAGNNPGDLGTCRSEQSGNASH